MSVPHGCQQRSTPATRRDRTEGVGGGHEGLAQSYQGTEGGTNIRTLVRGGVVSWPALTAGLHRYLVGADRNTGALVRDLGGCLAGRGFDAGAR